MMLIILTYNLTVLLTIIITLTPSTGSPFWTTLLCTICYVDWFFINTITIIHNLICSFTDTSNSSKSIASIASGWTWWPTACSPNKSKAIDDTKSNENEIEWIHSWMYLFFYLCLCWGYGVLGVVVVVVDVVVVEVVGAFVVLVVVVVGVIGDWL